MLLFFKVIVVLLWIALLLPFQIIFIFLKSKLRFWLPVYFHKFLLKVLGIKLSLKGKPSDLTPLVLIGNHSTYLDIIILSSVMPVCFVAKSEIKSWFFFGFLQGKDFQKIAYEYPSIPQKISSLADFPYVDTRLECPNRAFRLHFGCA